jgi:hypothetical protein
MAANPRLTNKTVAPFRKLLNWASSRAVVSRAEACLVISLDGSNFNCADGDALARLSYCQRTREICEFAGESVRLDGLGL